MEISLLGAGMSYEGVEFTRKQQERLLAFYGYDHDETEKQVARACELHEKLVAAYRAAKAAPRRYSDPAPADLGAFDAKGMERFLKEGGQVNILRRVARDGLRVMALLAPFLECGEDPVRLAARGLVAAGYDVQVDRDRIDPQEAMEDAEQAHGMTNGR